MENKVREKTMEERKARSNKYLADTERNRLKGVVECLIDVGGELEHIDCNDIRKKRVARIIDELLLTADDKYVHLRENEPEFLGSSEGYKGMLEIIQGVIRMSGYR